MSTTDQPVSRTLAVSYVAAAVAAAWLVELGTVLTVIAGVAVALVALVLLALVVDELAPHGRVAASGGIGGIVLLAGLATWAVTLSLLAGLLVVVLCAIAAGVMLGASEQRGATLARADELEQLERERAADEAALEAGIRANPDDGPDGARFYR